MTHSTENIDGLIDTNHSEEGDNDTGDGDVGEQTGDHAGGRADSAMDRRNAGTKRSVVEEMDWNNVSHGSLIIALLYVKGC